MQKLVTLVTLNSEGNSCVVRLNDFPKAILLSASMVSDSRIAQLPPLDPPLPFYRGENKSSESF